MTTAAVSSSAADRASVAGREPPRSRFGPGFEIGALSTAGDCQAAIEEIAAEIATIEGQIEIRSPEAQCSEEARIWLARARTALRHRRAKKQAMQYRLGLLMREERAERHRSGRNSDPQVADTRLREFARVCRDRLDRGLVDRLWDEVDERLGGGGQAA